MKRAKQRLLPTLARLISSIKRTDRSLGETLAFCAASNKRIAKKGKRAAVKALGKYMLRKKYTLDELLGQCDPTAPHWKEWDIGPPVGREFGAAEATEAMLKLMQSTPTGRSVENMKALKNEGRD